MNTILCYKDEISLVANIITILAFILAIIAFFNWKKEQKDSKKLDYIMELEDKFEVLIYSIEKEFKFFIDIDNNLIDIEDKDKEYKRQLNDFIKEKHEEYTGNKTLNKDFYEYSLSLVRVKRFIKNIDKDCTILDYFFLQKLNMRAIEVTPKWIDKENISEESKKFLKEIGDIHSEGLEYLQKLYK